MLVCSLCEEDGRGNSALWTRLSRLVCAASVSPCALPLASPPAPRGPGRALLHSILPSIPAAHTRRSARPDTGEISDSDRMPKATLSFIKRNVDRAPLWLRSRERRLASERHLDFQSYFSIPYTARYIQIESRSFIYRLRSTQRRCGTLRFTRDMSHTHETTTHLHCRPVMRG